MLTIGLVDQFNGIICDIAQPITHFALTVALIGRKIGSETITLQNFHGIHLTEKP